MKILAIDDNRDNLTALRAVVQDALPGCELAIALNGPQGLELARSEDPDVILLDIVMPGMDGFEVCRRLKADETLCSIPVVFATALRTDRASRVKALEVGAEAFLSKPLDEVELVAEVRAMTKLKAANRLQRLEQEQLAALVAERTHELEQELAERKRVEAALRESQAQFSSMFELASVGMAQADPATGQWCRVNQKLCEITGYSAAELLKLRVSEITHPEDREPDWVAFQRVVQGEEPDYRLEKRYLRKDGSTAWVNVNMTIIRAAGLPARTMATIEDITARKQAEEHIQSQLVELQRWQAVMLGRADRSIKLKREVNELCRRLGEPLRYPSQADETGNPAT